MCVIFPLGHSVLQTILYKRANDFMASTIYVSSLHIFVHTHACMHTHAVKETQLVPPAGLASDVLQIPSGSEAQLLLE